MAHATTISPQAVAKDRVRLLERTIRTDHDAGLLVLRISLAVILFPHGAQHLLGWFGGYGFAGTFQWMTQTLGFPGFLAALAILTEFTAPFALAAGFLGRIASLGIIGLMVGAISTHLPNGFFMNWFGTLPAGAEGYEYHLLVIAICVALVLRGSGAWSVDRVLSLRGEQYVTSNYTGEMIPGSRKVPVDQIGREVSGGAGGLEGVGVPPSD